MSTLKEIELLTSMYNNDESEKRFLLSNRYIKSNVTNLYFKKDNKTPNHFFPLTNERGKIF